MILQDGDRHKHKRRLLTPPFHGEHLLYYSRLTCEITKQVTKPLRVGKPFRVRLLIQEIVLGLILQAVFGVREGQRYQQIRKLLASIVDFTTTSPFGMSLFFFPSLRQDWGPLSPWGHFLRQKQKHDEFISEEIRERREQGEHSSRDVLSVLMSAHDEAGQPMSNKEILDEVNAVYQRGDSFRDFDQDIERFFIGPTVTWKIDTLTDLTVKLEYTDDKQPYDDGLVAFGRGVIDVPRERIIQDLRTHPDQQR